ncbi:MULTISPECIES: AAA family ATPase [Olivibacter]|uniref:AAA family ATPase n=2 Tax=Olivibacter TaxID=376469 RepID=A0ABV6HPN3_9SPHI|nr:AAA family ATPase [Olivibacter jilunii]MDX3914540.1 AAA family ATPase [Pseudosphingobacterium sp.]
MSILKFIEIKKLSIFDNFSWNCSEDFRKYNLIFGFNGSGKSTLSNLFNLIAKNQNFPSEKKQDLFDDLKCSDDAKVKFLCTDKETLLYPLTGDGHNNNKSIYVFNSNFVADHVFDGRKGKIQKFNVAETVLEDPEIVELNEIIEKKELDKGKSESEQEEYKSSFEAIKQQFNKKFRETFPSGNLRNPNFPDVQSIPTENKSDLELAIRQKISEYQISKDQAALIADIEKLGNVSFSQISLDFPSLKTLLNTTAREKAVTTLKSKIETFQAKVNEEDISKIEPWYRFGKLLLEKSNQTDETTCPLCNSNLNNTIIDLIKEFGEYFDSSYEEFKQNIADHTRQLATAQNFCTANKDSKTTLQQEATKYNAMLENKMPDVRIDGLTSQIKTLTDLVDDKGNNSSKIIDFELTNIQSAIENYNEDIKKLTDFKDELISTLQARRKSPETLETDIRRLYSKLIILELNGHEDKNNVKKYHELSSQIATYNNELIQHSTAKMQRLRALKLEAKKVGEYLEKLGINHFTIDLNEEDDNENILIKYNNSEKIRKRLRNTLSDGEKTALAFAYFLSKVTTEVKDKGNTIIVIDDPISSLDDNRLYQTAYLIHKEFKDYRQLFILSHNLLFMKFLNPNFRVKTSKSCYLINRGCISDLPKSLQNFQSPYFYMLESLLEFSSDETPNYEEARKYLPNYIRRILETFFSFKYAQLTTKSNANQSAGLEYFISDIIDFETLPDTSVGKISKDNIQDKLSNINKLCDGFSHGNTQHLDESNFITDDALRNIALETIDIIEYFDGFHSTNLKKLITKQTEDDNVEVAITAAG